MSQTESGPETGSGTATAPPGRDQRIAKAIIVNSISLAFMIAEGEIDESQVANALQGMAQAYKLISDREFGEYGLTDRVTDRILNLRRKIANGEVPG